MRQCHHGHGHTPPAANRSHSMTSYPSCPPPSYPSSTMTSVIPRSPATYSAYYRSDTDTISPLSQALTPSPQTWSSSAPRSNALDIISRSLSAPPMNSYSNSLSPVRLQGGDTLNHIGGNFGSGSWEAAQASSVRDSSSAQYLRAETPNINFAALRYSSPGNSGFAYSYSQRG
jgi:hypothetical protein